MASETASASSRPSVPTCAGEADDMSRMPVSRAGSAFTPYPPGPTVLPTDGQRVSVGTLRDVREFCARHTSWSR